MSHHNRPHHSRNQHNGQGNRQHGNRGAPPVHKPNTITVSQALEDIEQFQNKYGFSNTDSMQDRSRELNYKQEESALSNKFQEALGINQGQINGLVKLQHADAIRAFMEDPKRHEYAAFRTFEFIFRIPEHLDFDRLNRESTSTNEMRYKLLCKLMSLGICKACAGLVDNRDKRDDHRYNRTLNAIALWMKINHKKIAHSLAKQVYKEYSFTSPAGGDLYKLALVSPRLCAMLISCFGEIYRDSLPPPLLLDIIATWLDNEPLSLFYPLYQNSNIWLGFLKPEHYTDANKFIPMAGLKDLIAWSIRLALENNEKDPWRYHLVLIRSISTLTKVQSKMTQRKNELRLWPRESIRALVGELMQVSKKMDDQLTNDGSAKADTVMETVIDRFAQIAHAMKCQGAMKDCSPAQFNSLVCVLPRTKMLDIASGTK
ncbi:Oidioi.mRNA.OKI2018_I69.chr1.g2098.t1.cds [Oikopleura dioica]|uniref:Oidioi.mRNA.OKI2018_I69.chr1.g2098.t1.cds n=1 Tax=Oikopleura dioica TaxID=34765 RepID=A0ABN7SV50_OIKDI|nr:Oidioi.mRNA.OKI2018_I69.chr1.g2098.t1.cds [Oikopleura dioica]